jgi:hypothetical protein
VAIWRAGEGDAKCDGNQARAAQGKEVDKKGEPPGLLSKERAGSVL